MIELDDKLAKILELARHGVGGEQKNAIEIVKRICEERDISFEDVMRADDVREYRIPYKRGEKKIITHILYRYAKSTHKNGGFSYWPGLKQMQVFCTPGEYIQLTYLIDLYLEAYKKERSRMIAALPGSFIRANHLFSQEPSDDDRPSKPLTYKQYQQLMLEQSMAEGMNKVEVNKGIGDGK